MRHDRAKLKAAARAWLEEAKHLHILSCGISGEDEHSVVNAALHLVESRKAMDVSRAYLLISQLEKPLP